MPKLTERPLAPMQARFVDEYLVDLNASAAAARAGYSPRTCGQLGHRMLKDARIQAAIAEKARTATAKVDLQTEDVLRELVLMLRSDVRHFTVDEAGELTLADEPRWLDRPGDRVSPLVEAGRRAHVRRVLEAVHAEDRAVAAGGQRCPRGAHAR
jgi:hypothetical protein